jgi:hypothetical protein
MERRLYFLVGDMLATAGAGAVAGLAALAVTAEGSNMLVAMLIGMPVGMAVALPIAFAFAPFFGAMEVMVPTMLGGMLSGMWIAMAEAMRGLSGTEAAVWGALAGLLGLAITSVANAFLRADA